MPEVAEQRYYAEQICIPPTFPYLLRQFAKAAIRTQPADLLKWSSSYFRCLAMNIPPPVKPRLEYPIPRDYLGITPGWLKALYNQMNYSQTIDYRTLWDRWTGACLNNDALIQILCLGGFTKPAAIPWLQFIALCAGHLTNDLTETMTLICQILTEEPEGGSALIPVETFVDVYKFLAPINASQPQTLKNMYFLNTLLELWQYRVKKLDEELVKPESVAEEEKASSAEEEVVEEEEDKRVTIGTIVSCPSLSSGSLDTLGMPAHAHFHVEDYVIDQEESEEGSEGMKKSYEGEVEPAREEETEHPKEVTEEEVTIMDDADSKISEVGVIAQASDADLSVDTFLQVPQRKLVEESDSEVDQLVKEDLAKLKILHAELMGESDDDIRKFKCDLIADMPMDPSMQDALTHYKGKLSTEQIRHHEYTNKGKSVVEDEDLAQQGDSTYTNIYVDKVAGVGGAVPEALVEAVCAYMYNVALGQHGMVMPRNLRHPTCPPLE